MINPMEYISKSIISYKNPARPTADTYTTSIYSGMIYNGYCWIPLLITAVFLFAGFWLYLISCPWQPFWHGIFCRILVFCYLADTFILYISFFCRSFLRGRQAVKITPCRFFLHEKYSVIVIIVFSIEVFVKLYAVALFPLLLILCKYLILNFFHIIFLFCTVKLEKPFGMFGDFVENLTGYILCYSFFSKLCFCFFYHIFFAVIVKFAHVCKKITITQKNTSSFTY